VPEGRLQRTREAYDSGSFDRALISETGVRRWVRVTPGDGYALSNDYVGFEGTVRVLCGDQQADLQAENR